MITYNIQRTTTANDWLVRDQTDRQLARFPTEAEATAWVAGRTERDAAQFAESQRHMAEQDAWDKTVPDLLEQQWLWQSWRSWLYAAMMSSAKHTAQMQRALDRKAPDYAGRPSFEKQEGYLAKYMGDDQRAHDLYTRACELDTRIKDARRSRDMEALAAALAETPAMIMEMEPMLSTSGISQPITLPTLTCLRCGHSWRPRRDERPGVCPECKHREWDKPRRVKPESPPTGG
jgi:rubrerythrin